MKFTKKKEFVMVNPISLNGIRPNVLRSSRLLLLCSSMLLVACNDLSTTKIAVNDGERAATASTIEANRH